MATPFFVGCGVAAGAMALKGLLHVGQHVKAPNMPNMSGAAPHFQAAGAAFNKMYADTLNRLSGANPGGFEKQMTRREAAAILGIKESAVKGDLKEAHRKMMLLNHPDKGGSPFIASKINEALDTLSTRSKRSSAF